MLKTSRLAAAILVICASPVFAGKLAAAGSERIDQPFGTFKFLAPKNAIWDQWQRVKAEIATEMPRLARCQVQPVQCNAAERRFAAVITEAEARYGIDKIELVNHRINAEIRYVPDEVQWGVGDRWSAPVDANNLGSFDTGKGDCEDYAISKYFALRAAGISAQDLRVVLGHDLAIRLDHAVLAVRHDKRWLILDNRSDALFEDTEIKQFKPLLVVDESGVALLAEPFRLKDRIVPSSGQHADQNRERMETSQRRPPTAFR